MVLMNSTHMFDVIRSTPTVGKDCAAAPPRSRSSAKRGRGKTGIIGTAGAELHPDMRLPYPGVPPE